jgi:carboxymethylenebutenolidase
VRITLPSGTPAELATPSDGRAPTVGIALCPDIMGLRPLFDDLCRRLADEHGWAVCAIEPFPGREGEPIEQRLSSPLREHLSDDMLAAADATGAERTAAIGFCMGGMVAFQCAGLGRFDRIVSFYGMIRLPDSWKGGDMIEPLDSVAEAEASDVLAIVAGNDQWAPPGDVEALRAAGGEKVEVVVYPEAQHGFVHDPSRPTHRADDAADAWRRTADYVNRA